jgi:toxin FitB
MKTGWIEYLTDSPWADFYASAIEKTGELIVPVVCIAEVFKKVFLEADEDSALLAVAQMRQGKVIPLTESIALTAATLGIEKQLPFADSVIYATGIISGAVIFTQDKHFRNLPGVQYLSLPA